MSEKIFFLLPPPFIDGNRSLSPRGELPHQIVQLATCIKEQNKFSVKIIDAFLENSSFTKIIKLFLAEQPRYIALPLAIINREFSYAYILKLHNKLQSRLPNAKIILFNWFYPRDFVQRIIKHQLKTTAKYFLFGDIEESLPLLLDKITRAIPMDSVPGLLYKKNKSYKQTTAIHIMKNLDRLPLPDWSLLDMQRYRIVPHRAAVVNFYPIRISRGCPWHRCIFCQESSTSARERARAYIIRSPESAIQEIKYAIQNFQVTELQFTDVQFPSNKKWLLEFSNLLKKNNINIKWSCLSIITAFDFAGLKLLKNIGCYSILFGIESFDQQMLDFVKKGHTEKQIKEAIKNCRKLKIKITGTFLMGLPGEKPSDIIKNSLKAVMLGIDYFELFIAKWYANPPQELKSKYNISEWTYSKYDFYGPIVVPPGYKNLNHLKFIQKTAYFTFYCHPLTIVRHIFNIKTFYDVKRMFSAVKILKNLASE